MSARICAAPPMGSVGYCRSAQNCGKLRYKNATTRKQMGVPQEDTARSLPCTADPGRVPIRFNIHEEDRYPQWGNVQRQQVDVKRERRVAVAQMCAAVRGSTNGIAGIVQICGNMRNKNETSELLPQNSGGGGNYVCCADAGGAALTNRNLRRAARPARSTATASPALWAVYRRPHPVFFFTDYPYLTALVYILDAVFILNIASHFYIDFESEWRTVTSQVRVQYLKGWFLLDVLCVLPLELVMFQYGYSFYFYLNRALKIVGLFHYMASLEKHLDVNKVYLAAFRYTWVLLLYNPVTSPHQLYVTSLYWSTVTLSTVGYGDIYPTDLEEMFYTTFWMVVGLVAITGHIVTGMSSICANLDARRGRFYHRLQTIKTYMRETGLPLDMQTWVYDFYIYLWRHQKGSVSNKLVEDLPFNLHSEISSECHQAILRQAALFQDTGEAFQRVLSVKLKTITYSPGQILAKAGDIVQSMHFIQHGRVQAIRDGPNNKVATLFPGALIGEVYLTGEIPRNVTIVAETVCEACVLELKDLGMEFAHFPQGFQSEGRAEFFLAVSWIADVVAVLDIVFRCCTQVHSNDGYLLEFKSIFNHYVHSWDLVFDVLTFFPFDVFSFFTAQKQWAVFRLNRLLWIRKLFSFFAKNEKNPEKNWIEYRTAKCAFLLLLAVHFCAGLFYLQGCYYTRCDEDTWAWDNGLGACQSHFYHYVVTFYWAITTMTTTGFGDITASTLSEQIVTIFVCIIGLFVFNYLNSLISATLASTNSARFTFQDNLRAVTQFMKSHKLSQSLQDRVIDYMSLLWEKYQGQAFPGSPFLMHDLPSELQEVILMEERGKLLSKYRYFKEAGDSLIRDIATVSTMYFYPRGEIIQYKDCITRELFFIKEGTCQGGFLYGKPAQRIVRAQTMCQVIVIDFDRLKPILDNHPVIKSQFERLQAECLQSSECVWLRKEPQIIKTVNLSCVGRQFHEKSKCYVEDFGIFEMYAGNEEEHVEALRQTSQTQPERAIIPNGSRLFWWECFRLLLALTICAVSSLLWSFLHFQQDLWKALVFLLIVCWIDMYIRLHVAFSRGSRVVVDTVETAKQYLKTGFLMDFVSCFPWEVFGLMAVSTYDDNNTFFNNTRALHIIAFFSLPHMLQLYRVNCTFKHWQAGVATEKTAVSLLKFCLYAMLFLHFCTCVVFAAVCPPGTDFSSKSGDKYFLPKIQHNCTADSWVMHLDNLYGLDFDTVSFPYLYTISLYFITATVTTVGYGDISACLLSTKIIVSAIMVSGPLFCGWVGGSMTSILANADAPRVAFMERKDGIKHFLERNGLTGDFYENIIQFLESKWRRMHGIDQDSLFRYLPSSLRGDISTFMYADLIAKAFGIQFRFQRRVRHEAIELSDQMLRLSGKLDGPIFHKMLRAESLEKLEYDGGITRMLSRQVRHRFFRMGNIVYKRGDCESEMFFIQKGEVEVLAGNGGTVLFTLKVGQYFGEDSFLHSEPRAATIRAASNCDLCVLTKKSFEETFQYYPDIYQEFKQVVEEVGKEIQKTKLEEIAARSQLPFSNQDQTSSCHQRPGLLELYEQYARAEALESSLPLWVRLGHRLGSALLTCCRNTWRFIQMIRSKTIDPKNPVLRWYQYFSAVVTVVHFWCVTYMPAVYNADVNLYLFASVVEYIQFVEVLVIMNICYYDEDGNYVSNRKSVARHFLWRKLGFFFYFVSSFPYGATVFHLATQMPAANYLAIFVWVRAAQLVRIFSVLVFLRQEEKAITSSLLAIRLLKYLVHFLLLNHCCALVFVALSCPSMCIPGSWYQQVDVKKFTDLYLYSVYWTLTTYTSTGFGDIVAMTKSELWFAIVFCILAKVHIVYNLGMIFSTLANKHVLQVANKEKLQDIKSVLRDNNISPKLRDKIIHYFKHKWICTRGRNSETIFRDIPRYMRADIFDRTGLEALQQHDVLAKMSTPFLEHLSTTMRLLNFTPGEYLARRGDIATQMFVVVNGTVKVVRNGQVEFLSTGATYGGNELVLQMKYRESWISDLYVEVLALLEDDFFAVASLYRYDMDSLNMQSIVPQADSQL
ncbi:cyclic nucleotide-gated cation channel alpha-3-like [Amia ocellicauda]|uniref:cyclic nucleotide-gated cation channel alpha-3-like n=1 Tax=Amia ocellicauda TaxID=2972642 RepID=UPI00346476C2